jgi:drug/metabolite transporter (DMT)-like permease
VAALSVVILCWGCVPVMLRQLTHTIDPWLANSIRYPLSAILFWPVLIYFYHRGTLTRQVIRQCMVPAMCALASQILWASAPYYLPASPIGFLARLSMLFSILFAMLWVREERKLLHIRQFYYGLLATTVGFLLLSLGAGFQTEEFSLAGLLIMLGFSVLIGLYVVSVRTHLHGIHPILSFGVIAQMVSLGVLVMGSIGGNWQMLPQLPTSSWILLVISSVLGIATAHTLLYTAVHRLGASVTAGIQNLTPLVTALLAILFLHERLSVIQWSGGLMILLGSAWLLRAHKKTGAAN